MRKSGKKDNIFDLDSHSFDSPKRNNKNDDDDSYCVDDDASDYSKSAKQVNGKLIDNSALKSPPIHESDLIRVSVVDKTGGRRSSSDYEKARIEKYSKLASTRPRLLRSAKKQDRDYSFSSGISTNSSEGQSEVRIGARRCMCCRMTSPLNLLVILSCLTEKCRVSPLERRFTVLVAG